MSPEEIGFKPINDIYGRKKICFLCQGAGRFVLPSPEAYGRLLKAWSRPLSFEKVVELFSSEADYFVALGQRVGFQQMPWQMLVLEQWNEALRCHKGE
jgi:hypothetical protein